ncbi:MAG: glycosyltransferase [Thermoplasmata archaeon]|nr:MAG: glycosyltransferase [Thermoplasmata archaeon]
MPMKLSVIIPTLNEEEQIQHTLQAVKGQRTDFEFDIIVCDGGSTDKTTRLASRHARVLNSPVVGKSKQLNYAAKKTKSDILVFIDADITIPPNYLQQIYNMFGNDENLWACGTNFRHSTDGYGFSDRLKIHFVNFHMPKFYDFHAFFGMTKLPGCSFCIRRDIFMEAGGFKNIPNEDSVLSNELRQLAKKRGYGKLKYIRTIKVTSSPRKILELGALKIFGHYSRRGLEAKRIQREAGK